MPRGRHRHSPPLHRLLPPSVIAGVSLTCAFGPWVFSDPGVLRIVAAIAAATAVVGAAVLRRWDLQAGKQVADLTRARASDEWRFEERVAELETDLEESRELRVKLEQRLRAKRTELAGLRNEHAALLRRYATAETERASALEGRRLLEMETTSDVPALPPARVSSEVERDQQDERDDKDRAQETEAAAASAVDDADDTPGVPKAFSAEGSKLFVRARVALAKLDPEMVAAAGSDAAEAAEPVAEAAKVGAGEAEDEAEGKPEAVDEHARAAAAHPADEETEAPAEDVTPETAVPAAGAVSGAAAPAPRPAAPVVRPSGHFTVPTAVAVVPAAAPVRRPTAEGGFDFFGTKSAALDSLDAVHNEDLADVVGQEALALHKAEAEAEFKPAGEESRGVGQVIDLTAHDETEVIDLQGLRTKVS
ncbi:hypothetical protein [Streptomyces sp. NPDC002588]|uniref:hypothetical protein n=1 Tax=Streptomyces sp. NPDC002588 TaxID=3154419 RepID=UPI00332A7FDD